MSDVRAVKTFSAAVAVCLLAAVIGAGVLLYGAIADLCSVSLDELPEGELELSIDSEDGEYTLNVYLVSLNALSRYGYRGEVVHRDSGEARTVYFEYPVEHTAVNAAWDGDAVWINGVSVNAEHGVYDSREEK